MKYTYYLIRVSENFVFFARVKRKLILPTKFQHVHDFITYNNVQIYDAMLDDFLCIDEYRACSYYSYVEYMRDDANFTPWFLKIHRRIKRNRSIKFIKYVYFVGDKIVNLGKYTKNKS